MRLKNPIGNPESYRKDGFDSYNHFRRTGDISFAYSALALAERALTAPSQTPEKHKAYYLMAIVYLAIGDNDRSLEAVELGLNESPDDKNLLKFRRRKFDHLHICSVNDPDVDWKPVFHEEVDRDVEWIEPPSL